MRRWLWLAGLYLAALAVLGAVALAIRAVLTP